MPSTATGVNFPVSAFEAAVAADPEVLGVFYSGSQGRGTMDRYSDLDLKVWVTDAALAEGGRKIAELLATLGEVKFCSPPQPVDSVHALIGPDWQRVDLDLLTERTMKPSTGYAGSRIIKDTDDVLARLIDQSPERRPLPPVEQAADYLSALVDSQIFLALHNARGAGWSAMGEIVYRAVDSYCFLARLRGVESYGARYVEHLLTPEEQRLLRASWPSCPEKDEVRRAGRALWNWVRHVWSETEQVLGTRLPLCLHEEGLLDAIDQIYDEG